MTLFSLKSILYVPEKLILSINLFIIKNHDDEKFYMEIYIFTEGLEHSHGYFMVPYS